MLTDDGHTINEPNSFFFLFFSLKTIVSIFSFFRTKLKLNFKIFVTIVWRFFFLGFSNSIKTFFFWNDTRRKNIQDEKQIFFFSPKKITMYEFDQIIIGTHYAYSTGYKERPEMILVLGVWDAKLWSDEIVGHRYFLFIKKIKIHFFSIFFCFDFEKCLTIFFLNFNCLIV